MLVMIVHACDKLKIITFYLKLIFKIKNLLILTGVKLGSLVSWGQSLRLYVTVPYLVKNNYRKNFMEYILSL